MSATEKHPTGIRIGASNHRSPLGLRQISRVPTPRGICSTLRPSLCGGFPIIRQGLESLNWSRPLGLPDWPPSRVHGEVGTCGARSCLELRLVTFPPRYRSALKPSGGTHTNMARSHRGGCHDRSAERSSAILVFGRVRYRGCDCGRDHTDLT
jgi:hypothetical protein